MQRVHNNTEFMAQGPGPMHATKHVLETCACQSVREAARSVTRSFDEALKPSGLRATQFSVLVAIDMGGVTSIVALAKVLGMDRSTLTRNLAPLARRGFLCLQRHNRGRAVEISVAGRAIVRQTIPLWESAQESLERRVGAADWKRLNDGLCQLSRALG